MSILTSRIKYSIILCGDIVKKLFSILILISVFASLYGCADKNSSVILDNSENSYFVDFYTEGDSVYIECVLNIYSESDTEITISAIDNENVEGGLLKSPTLTGIDKNDNDEIFKLQAGENEVTVLFKGEYAGVFNISKREIPRFIEIDEK